MRSQLAQPAAPTVGAAQLDHTTAADRRATLLATIDRLAARFPSSGRLVAPARGGCYRDNTPEEDEASRAIYRDTLEQMSNWSIFL